MVGVPSGWALRWMRRWLVFDMGRGGGAPRVQGTFLWEIGALAQGSGSRLAIIEQAQRGEQPHREEHDRVNPPQGAAQNQVPCVVKVGERCAR